MKRLVLFFILYLPLLLSAQHKLTGVVLEENDKGKFNPLAGVNVYWLGTSLGTSTDGNGTFEIECVHDSTQLVVSYVGYQPDTFQIETHEEMTIILKNAYILAGGEVTYRKKSTEISFLEAAKTELISQDELFKAACCNLSESFETNPSVDVSFTDAVTGTRQIQLLGLAGNYTLITQENMPFVRGLASNYGLTFIPGSWISSIQLMKGTGSVVNGFESVAGQINVELKKIQDQEAFFLNGYLSQEGRMELNTNFTNIINPKWSTTTLLHGHLKPFEFDRNEDNFADFPTGWRGKAMHRWDFKNYRGLESEFGLSYMQDEQRGGQIDFNPGSDKGTMNAWGFGMLTTKAEVFAKIGYVFPEKRYKSIGFQTLGSWHEVDSYFGLREYRASHHSAYTNLIYQSMLANFNHKFKTGLSYLIDRIEEEMTFVDFSRTEHVPGAFFEYTYTHFDKVSIVTGLRGDYNSLYGFFATPRIHTRFAVSEKTVLRLSAGRGQRTANIIAENLGLLASSRELIIDEIRGSNGFELLPEVAWNYGVNLTQEFNLGNSRGTFSVDVYRTDFQNQVVIDLDDDPQKVVFYNLDGKSYSNSIQGQVDMEPVKRFDIRIAYRWYDVRTDYTNGLLSKPLTAQHRAFLNVAYETFGKWKFDCTLQWQGKKRIPTTNSNPEIYQLDEFSPDFFLLNAQITKAFKKGVEIYLGMENIANFRQNNPILASEDPFGSNFDASLIWGPVFGRNTYAGFRYTLKHKDTN